MRCLDARCQKITIRVLTHLLWSFFSGNGENIDVGRTIINLLSMIITANFITWRIRRPPAPPSLNCILRYFLLLSIIKFYFLPYTSTNVGALLAWSRLICGLMLETIIEEVLSVSRYPAYYLFVCIIV